MISNADIVRALREMALFLEMDEVPFKPRAYESVAEQIATLSRSLAADYKKRGMEAIEEIPSVGKGIARRIAELIDTGKMADLDALRAKRPVDIFGLTSIEGIGPKSVKVLYDSLGITNLDNLAEAARSQMIRTVPRFGAKSEAKILRQLDRIHQFEGRLPIGEVLPVTHEIQAMLAQSSEVEMIAFAGSQRRFKETVGDIDILIASKNPGPVMDLFAGMHGVAEVYAKGDTKTMVRLEMGIDADLRVVDPECFGAALLYFTGNVGHNIKLRIIAQKLGLKLNEYGVFRGEDRLACRTEEEVYAVLGLPWFPPELREDEGEIEAAEHAALPTLIEANDILGDLQVQTTWTDGRASLEEMVAAAKERGFEYLVITDHTRDLYGLDERRLLEQQQAIRELDRKTEGIRVLSGAEVNIRRDGTLDVADEVLAQLDVVGAAVHSGFELPQPEQTARVIRAIQHPHVDVLFHPTARQIARREGLDLDLDAVIAAAVASGTILELDSLPQRLDLNARLVRKAIASGAKISIDSDAHRPTDFDCIRDYGIPTARRGWVTKESVVNALPVEEMLASVKRP
jgi:DNA polymerase (family X)